MDNSIGMTRNLTSKLLFAVNNNRKPKDEFRFGNYKNYYYKRLASGELQTDFRLELLEHHPELFRDKTVLDIGCNSGYLTINFAKNLRPASMLGIDIDGSLVDKARRHLEKEKTDGELSELKRMALSHVTFRKVKESNFVYINLVSDSTLPQANYILKDENLLSFEKPLYDVILCLSVTKWIHLNHGDAGIKFMFKRIFTQLKPNGILILEAQAFDTYKKRSKISQEILQNYRSIQLRPEKFESFLLSGDVGFGESWCIADKEVLRKSGQAKGFHRPLQVFIKS